MQGLNTHNYEFGDFRLDTVRRQLFRRQTGETVELTPRAILLLITLVCSDGRLLTKQELLDRVWAGSMVEEGNLSQTIFVLRKAIGDGTKQPKFIMTVPARGYQFIAPVVQMNERERLDLNSFNRFQNPGAVSTQAYRSYIQGRHFWNKRTGESLKKAIEHFDETLRQDPDFADAYAGLADCHRLLSEYYAAALQPGSERTGSFTAKGDDRNDPDLAEAHTKLAYAQAFYDWDWASADISFREALRLDPHSPTANQWYADLLCVVGRFAEARRYFDRAINLAPGSAVVATGLAGYFYTQKNADELVRQAKKVIALDPGFAYGHFYLGFGYEFAGQERLAVESFAVAARLFGEPAEIGEELLSAYEHNGMTSVWHKRLEQYETRPHLKNYPPYLKSLVPIRLGDKETSLAWLEQAYRQRDRGIIYAKFEPLLRPLRSDNRFQELIRKIGLNRD